MNEETPKLPDEELLETEAGMFFMEMEKLISETTELIDASTVDDVIKHGCKDVIHRLKERTENELPKSELYRSDPADLARVAVTELLQLLDYSDPEKNSLFDALKGVILKARNSAKGWQWPPKQV